jgi:ribonuclease HII
MTGKQETEAEKHRLRHEKEMKRLNEMYAYEREAFEQGFGIVAGIDEAGRGPLAGPVVAACVILPQYCLVEGINDSKKLSPPKREKLYDVIMDRAISVGIGIVDEKTIDELNILNATKIAMKTALDRVSPAPELLLTDAVELYGIDIPQKALIKGDSLSISIAAASIVAKVTRDRLLIEADKKYPLYGFSKHKGYGTRQHIDAIKKYGICPIHRVSFTKSFTL